jgi:hypothetical protein
MYSTTIKPGALSITTSNQQNYGNIISKIQGSSDFSNYVQKQIDENGKKGAINVPSDSAHSLDFSKKNDLYVPT